MSAAVPRVARVLLVDDHPLVRAAVRQALAGPDLEVVGEASSCTEALDLTEVLRPDLVLLDLDLPGRSGLEYLREIRPRVPTARVVVLTVSGADRDLVEAVRLGAAGYVTKDITGESLLSLVRAALRGELPMPGPIAAAAITELASGRQPEHRKDDRIDALTVREREVLELISAGDTDRAAAAKLGISARTVEAHVGSILRRLDARSRADAARLFRSATHTDGPAGDPPR